MLLRALVVPVMRLLGTESGRGTGTIDDLESLLTDEPAEAPEDPVLARLLPDAYRDDPAAAGEFRKYTESSLRESKKYFAQALLDTLPSSGGRVMLTGDQARDWMRALNDVRLMFGVRLEVTEDFEEQLAGLDPADPKLPSSRCTAGSGRSRSPCPGSRQVISPIMLTISRDLYEKIIAHARADHPDEACGVIAGPAGSDRPNASSRCRTPNARPPFTASTPSSSSGVA